MKSLFESQAQDEIRVRLRRLQPEAPRRWGRMTSREVVVHLADQLGVALGHIPTWPRRSPLRLPLVRYLVIHWLPWPRGRIQAPREAFTSVPAEWAADLARLHDLLDQFGRADPQAAWAAHPMFGTLGGPGWGCLSYRHFDHHLRQFGV